MQKRQVKSAKPVKIRVHDTAIAELQKMGWVTESDVDGTTLYVIAVPTAPVPIEQEEWPEFIG